VPFGTSSITTTNPYLFRTTLTFSLLREWRAPLLNYHESYYARVLLSSLSCSEMGEVRCYSDLTILGSELRKENWEHYKQLGMATALHP